MHTFDQRPLNSVNLVVGAFALAVVLAMSSEVQAQVVRPDHDPGNPFVQLSMKLDAVLAAISALPVSSDHTALSAELDEVRDAITARFPLDDDAGFAKLTGSGAIPISVEGILFEWVRDSRAPEFKAIHQLVR